jgi:hypothetical protein
LSIFGRNVCVSTLPDTVAEPARRNNVENQHRSGAIASAIRGTWLHPINGRSPACRASRITRAQKPAPVKK